MAVPKFTTEEIPEVAVEGRRKPERTKEHLKMVFSQIEKRGIRNPGVLEAIHFRRAVHRTAFCTRRLRASVDSGCGLMHRTRPLPYSPTMTAGVLIMVPSCGLYLDTSLRKYDRERKLPSPPCPSAT